MKKFKIPQITIVLSILFLVLFLLWLKSTSKTKVARELYLTDNLEAHIKNDEIGPVEELQASRVEKNKKINISESPSAASDEEREFYQRLSSKLPSFEQMNKDCFENFSSYRWDYYPIDKASSFNADEVGELTFYFYDSLVKMSEVPGHHYNLIFDFIVEYESSDPEKLYYLLTETTKTCVDQKGMERLRDFIERSSSFNWSDEAKYKFSNLTQELLRVFQYMPTQDRLIFYMDVLEAMERNGFITFNGHSILHELRVKIEGIHLHLLDNMHSTRLSPEEKNKSMRNYLIDLSVIADELTQTASAGIHRYKPESMSEHP